MKIARVSISETAATAFAKVLKRKEFDTSKKSRIHSRKSRGDKVRETRGIGPTRHHWP